MAGEQGLQLRIPQKTPKGQGAGGCWIAIPLVEDVSLELPVAHLVETQIPACYCNDGLDVPGGIAVGSKSVAVAKEYPGDDYQNVQCSGIELCAFGSGCLGALVFTGGIGGLDPDPGERSDAAKTDEVCLRAVGIFHSKCWYGIECRHGDFGAGGVFGVCCGGLECLENQHREGGDSGKARR